MHNASGTIYSFFTILFMKTIPWENKSPKHPNGVCKAATSNWLADICYKGISEANKLTAWECDSLQSKCEKGQYTWSLQLTALMGGEDKASFDAWHGPDITDSASIEAVLKGMKENDFYIISASGPRGDEHTVAGFFENRCYYFFDPKYAMYTADLTELKQLVDVIIKNLAPWTNRALRSGYII